MKIYKDSKKIAIAWVENYTPHSSVMPEIAQKQKLAKDISKAIDKYVRAAIAYVHCGDKEATNRNFKEFKNIMKHDL